MTIKRKLTTIYTPAKHQGFMGPDHTARGLIQGSYLQSDPFILLMDDVLDKQNGDPVGGPHPHAGFETVSLLLEGEMGDAPHQMKKGGFQLMTAGSGIIHTETINTHTQMRLLQLWLNLPAKDRWAAPRLQELTLQEVPKKLDNGVEMKVYSGSLGGLTSQVQNYTPLIVADINMQPGSATVLEIPAQFNTLIYVLEGSIQVGENKKDLVPNQVGWLDLPGGQAGSELTVTAGISGGRFVLYSGEPQGDPIVSHGPFIGDNQDDINRLYREYRHGKMNHISSIA
jgi:redox-sensitive bicupin YhaK (pirin superfamily)